MKKYLLITFLSFCVFKTNGQDSNWSVNAADYQYSMTVTAFLNINGATLSSNLDKVAAFVNGEVRGAANVVYEASFNKYVAYLTVYANTSNEVINFKIFDSTANSIVEVLETQNFVIDGKLGNIFQSFSIAKPALSSEAVLNSFSFLGITSVSTNITNQKIEIVVPKNTAITNLIPQFNISDRARFFVNGLKQISGVSAHSFTTPKTFILLSENEATLLEFEVSVILDTSNIDIPQLTLSIDVGAFSGQSPFIISLQTNVAISSFTADAISLTNAVVSTIVKIDEFKYSLSIAPIQQGLCSVEISENSIFNAENEGNIASNKLNFTYDIVRPYVLSIKRNNPLDELTDSNIIEFRVVFSEPVENVIATSFESVSGAVITLIKENDATYKVTLKGINHIVGAVSLHIKSANSIQDKAGNLLLNSIINVHQN
jgi:hypothetical protein